jgi:hypothetical protein
MVKNTPILTVIRMNSAKLVAALVMICLGSGLSLQAQNQFLLTFRGTTYQTNASGNVVARPATEQTWLSEAAQAGGVTDTSGMAVVYHVARSIFDFGDTIDVVNRASGATLTSLVVFFFGDENDFGQNLGRTALTNSIGTQTRRVDQLYIYYNNSFQSQQALGSAFTTKRFISDRFGNLHGTVDAELNYLMLPAGTNVTRMFVGTFTTTKPFVPGQ